MELLITAAITAAGVAVARFLEKHEQPPPAPTKPTVRLGGDAILVPGVAGTRSLTWKVAGADVRAIEAELRAVEVAPTQITGASSTERLITLSVPVTINPDKPGRATLELRVPATAPGSFSLDGNGVRWLLHLSFRRSNGQVDTHEIPFVVTDSTTNGWFVDQTVSAAERGLSIELPTATVVPGERLMVHAEVDPSVGSAAGVVSARLHWELRPVGQGASHHLLRRSSKRGDTGSIEREIDGDGRATLHLSTAGIPVSFSGTLFEVATVVELSWSPSGRAGDTATRSLSVPIEVVSPGSRKRSS